MLAVRSTPRPSGLASWLMNSTAVPRVYERWWRPAWDFLATAGRHTSMSQEYAAAVDALHFGPGATVIERRIEGVTQTLTATRSQGSNRRKGVRVS
jgi:hypothetical protein